MSNKEYSHLFPQLSRDDSSVYLDSAATSLKPLCVIEMLSNIYSQSIATVNRGVYPESLSMSERFEGVRSKVSEYIGAEADEIVFTRGTTDGLNALARTLRAKLSEGDGVLITQSEHHANILPWRELEKSGILVYVLPYDKDEGMDLDLLEEYLSSFSIAIVSCAHISNVVGIINPIKEIAEIVHRHNALLIVDGAQAIGRIDIDVKDLGADFYLFSSHKAYGPTGVGVVFGKKFLLEELPPFFVGGDMVEEVTSTSVVYKKAPFKHEAGTPAFVEIIGFGRALDFIYKDVGLDNIISHEKEIAIYLVESLANLKGVTLINKKTETSITAFTVDKIHPLDVATLLGASQVALRSGKMCAEPYVSSIDKRGVLRASCGIYTTHKDIDYFVEQLQSILSDFLP